MKGRAASRILSAAGKRVLMLDDTECQQTEACPWKGQGGKHRGDRWRLTEEGELATYVFR